MKRVFTTVALTFALGPSALTAVLAQNADQRGSMAGMMGGRCPMIGMMAPGLSGEGMMEGRQARTGAMVEGSHWLAA